jgi:hypothetical protein
VLAREQVRATFFLIDRHVNRRDGPNRQAHAGRRPMRLASTRRPALTCCCRRKRWDRN